MRGFLLDTNVVLIGMSEPERLSRSIRDAIQLGPNTISIVSYWEVVLKVGKGKLNVGDPRTWWKQAISDFYAETLALQAGHITELVDLPPLHQDPFDRALIAQARSEDLTLLTLDRTAREYATESFQVIG